MLTVSTPLLKRSLARVDRATLPKQAELHLERGEERCEKFKLR